VVDGSLHVPPPLFQAEQTFLASLLAQRAFPNDADMRSRLTADLLEQSAQRHRQREEKKAARAAATASQVRDAPDLGLG
jgi:hypothetical protein